MKRTLKTSTIGLALILVAGGNGCRTTEQPRPSILLVTIDTLRADRMSQHGYGLETCPQLDGFASRASVFTTAYAPSPWTLPSTASLMTGLAAGRQNVWIAGGAIPRELDTLAELLRQQRWRTLGLSGNIGISRLAQFDQGFETFLEHQGSNLEYPDITELTGAAVDWLERDAAEPFFIYLHPMNVHGPYRVPAPHASELLGRPPVGGFRYLDEKMEAIQAGQSVDVSDEYRTSLEEQYDTAIRYTCGQLALLIEQLETRGLYDDMLIVIASDHGEELFEHEGVGHGQSLYQELVRVPLWIKLPGQKEGMQIDTPVTLTDVFPTILELVGVEPLFEVDGRSLLPLLRSDPSATAEHGAEIFLFGNYQGRMIGRAIVAGRYKLVEIETDYRGAEHERRLFDLETDPQELHDISTEHPDLVQRLATRLEEQFLVYAADPLPEAPDIRDQVNEEVLRSLGYLN